MKIKSIMCNCSREFYEQNCGIRRAMGTPELEIDVVNIEKGPESLESATDDAIAAVYIMKQVLAAEGEGCDAVVLDCAVDPVVRAARETVNIPVVAAGESAFHAAMMVADRFSIVTVMPVAGHILRENIEKYGFSARVASIRSANIPVLELQDEERAFRAVLEASRYAVEHDGAEAIVTGCTGMIALRKRLQAALGVPVIEPLTMAIKFAVDLVEAGLSSSKKTYQTPKKSSVDFIRNV